MKKLDDEKLEELLFEALKKEPEVGLPLGFAAMVTRKAFTKPESIKPYILTVFIAMLVFAVAGLVLFSFNQQMAHRLFSLLVAVKYIILSVICGFLLIQYLDQKFVRKHIIV